MGLIINKTDFNGKYKLSQGKFNDIDSYIAKYEEAYLIDLLGYPLFELFEAAIGIEPIEEIYAKILEPFWEEVRCDILRSNGIKEMLLGFVWFEYVRDLPFKQTTIGVRVNESENSRESGATEYNIYGNYNNSVDTFKAIQAYIKENKTTYPTFKGIDKKYSYWV
jgi:hypothetical protein